jgi:hypothetical protein
MRLLNTLHVQRMDKPFDIDDLLAAVRRATATSA